MVVVGQRLNDRLELGRVIFEPTLVQMYDSSQTRVRTCFSKFKFIYFYNEIYERTKKYF